MVNGAAKKGIRKRDKKVEISMRRKWKNFNFMCWQNGDTRTKCRNRAFFPPSRSQCDVCFHFNLNVAFLFFCSCVLFYFLSADGLVGWHYFYLIACTDGQKNCHEKEMIFASEMFFYGVLIFHFIWAFVDYFALLAHFSGSLCFDFMLFCCHTFFWIFCAVTFLACVVRNRWINPKAQLYGY